MGATALGVVVLLAMLDDPSALRSFAGVLCCVVAALAALLVPLAVAVSLLGEREKIERRLRLDHVGLAVADERSDFTLLVAREQLRDAVVTPAFARDTGLLFAVVGDPGRRVLLGEASTLHAERSATAIRKHIGEGA